jgi:hypothetical protein
MVTWHYAVWKRNSYYMTPACVKYPDDLDVADGSSQGITINRGEVNCPDCRRMMGMVD